MLPAACCTTACLPTSLPPPPPAPASLAPLLPLLLAHLLAIAAHPPHCRRAAAWEHPEAVKLLVELGADVCHTNHMGQNA